MTTVVLMTSRSGSSLVCRILAEHGLRWQDGKHNPVQAARGHDVASYHTYEHPTIKAALKSCTHKDRKKRRWPTGEMIATTNPRLDILKKTMLECDPIDFVKSGVEFAQLWDDWAQLSGRVVNFIKVYRPPEDIAASLERRGIGSYNLGYETAVKRLKLMEKIPGWTVATNMLMATEDWGYSGIEDAVRSCGIEFDPVACNNAIKPEKFHV